MDKFNRNYILSVVNPNNITQPLTVITLPFTIEFDIQRQKFTAANTATVRIYNLGAQTRNLLLQDKINQGQQRQITLQVGYNNALYTILNATVTQCYSVREGNNFVTTISALDYGFAYVNATVPDTLSFVKGTTQETIILALMNTLGNYGIQVGTIGLNSNTAITRGTSYSGSVIDILSQITGGAFFIDNGKAHVLQDGQAFTTVPIPIISAQTGLLGTPIKEQITWKFDMLLEPSFLIGQLVQVNSTAKIGTVSQNQVYRIISLNHRGTISSAVCGDAITTIEGQAGNFNTV